MDNIRPSNTKKFIFHLSVLLILTSLVGCFSDTSTRRKSLVAVIESDSDGDASSSDSTVASMLDDDSDTFAATPTSSSSSSSSSNGTGYTHCNFNDYSYSVSTIGSVIACQSSSSKTKVKVKISETDLTNMTCLIPTYRDSYGSSFYIGPAQCLYHEKDTIYEGTFVIDRYGYTSTHFNAVMIMKYSLTDDYFNCMLGYTSCSTFKSNGGYIDYPF